MKLKSRSSGHYLKQPTDGPIDDLRTSRGERMALLKWSKRYSVNVNALDGQHAEFVRAMNEIHAAMLSGRGQDVTAPMLDRWLKLGREHFATEESIMESTGYPGLAEHRALHLEYAQRAAERIDQLRAGNAEMRIVIMRSIRDWLKYHLLHDDKKYTLWLNEHGVH